MNRNPFTTTKAPAQADVNETLSDLVWRNRHARYVALRQTTQQPAERTTEPVSTTRRRGGAWKLYTIIGMLLVVTVLVLWQQKVAPWWGGMQTQWHYGDNRVTVFDADVGHGGVSHFIAEYYHQSVVVVEIPAASFTKYQVYVVSGFFGLPEQPVVQLTLAPRPNGKPDLVVSIAGSGFGQTLYNTGNSFQMTPPGSN